MLEAWEKWHKTNLPQIRTNWQVIAKDQNTSQILNNMPYRGGGDSIAQWITYLLPDPLALGSNHNSGVFSDKISYITMLIDSSLLKANEQGKAQ